MTVMNSILRFSGLAALVFVLGACQSYEITPGSERVRVLDAEPKGCLYVGEIASVQNDKSVGTLETEMDLTTRIDLRNKAHALGGNILVFLRGKNTNTLPGTANTKSVTATTKVGGSGTAPADAQQQQAAQQEPPPNPNALVFLGTVFKCPSSILNQ